MPDLLIFAVAALAAVWTKGRLDQAATALAVFLAWQGVNEQGWIGWAWSWSQAGAYAGLAAALILILSRTHRREIEQHKTERKPVLDYVALVAWGVVQQAVLLGWMAQVSPFWAVVLFAVLHIPNPVLVPVTLAGGAASVFIAHQFGVPCILSAGLAHAVLSWFVRDVVGIDMGVGRGYDWLRRRLTIW